MNDCSLTPKFQFLAVSWQEQVSSWSNDDACFVQGEQDEDFYSASSLEQQSTGKHVTQTHYLTPTSHCYSSLMLHAKIRSSKYRFFFYSFSWPALMSCILTITPPRQLQFRSFVTLKL